MNHRKLAFIILGPLCVGLGAVTLYSFATSQLIQPVTPTFTYDNPRQQQRATTNQPSDTDSSTSERRTAAAPKPSPAPATSQDDTPLSPAHEAIKRSVAKEYTYHPLVAANDPGYASSWALQKINAPAAWDISTGNDETVLAVIDTGFALEHQDLISRWHVNAAETGTTTSTDRCWSGVAVEKRTNNCDDDANGYIDDWRGWNFYLGDNDPQTGRQNPAGAAVSHGTETAGLAGASGNNGAGISTVNWRTRLMPLQVLSDDGPGYTSDVVAAMRYAVDNGADVINLSLGAYEYDPAVKAAVDYAETHNVVVVAAAGNCGTGGESCDNYPAGTITYPARHPSVIAVGATTQTDERASFSSYGPAIDVVAPGSGTITTPTWTNDNQTTLYAGAVYGTSYAAPQVASLVTLIKSIRPASSIRDITALVQATTTKPSTMGGAIYSEHLGHGLINAHAALTVAKSLNTSSGTPILHQAGGVKSEHVLIASDTVGSGCTVNAGTYCTIRLSDHSSGYDRYLPYRQADTSGMTGWSWPATTIESGLWAIRSLQGNSQSTTPYLVGATTTP